MLQCNLFNRQLEQVVSNMRPKPAEMMTLYLNLNTCQQMAKPIAKNALRKKQTKRAAQIELNLG